ncbi:homoserine dehydrogenase [Collibacillus ludicampi]|uniref:Homoserine dehydrogenase n=1 Tax=Collibacillus ludicampi TaxID=2771369 RepID=A0AAV4L9Y2_9BACL|nr:homoserine dehydrogenase [Collibacillus ludicampi]GIM44464.1 homoserine dehydrogenase [Collibacillus ludicampi]
MKQKNVKIGLLGLGTVGTGVVKTLQTHQDQIEKRTGKHIEIRRILVRDLKKKRGVSVDPSLLTTSPEDLLSDSEISVIIEVMGGIEPAYSIIRKALQTGRHVVTANKELLAKHGAELLELAEKNGVQLWFEASVGGGIPVIRILQSYLHVNRVQSIAGILNGTCNFILSEMARTGRPYADVLKEAQALGYAEADPMNDVLGFDTMYKLAILSNLAFDIHIPPTAIETEGIQQIEPIDIEMAHAWGYVIKLIGSAAYTEGLFSASVGPRLLPVSHPLAQVNDVLNAVTISSDVVGELTFIGKGAGELPTASAVMEDLICLCSGGAGWRIPAFHKDNVQIDSEEQRVQTCYLRIAVRDERSNELSKRIEQVVHGLGGFTVEKHVRRLNDQTYVTYLIGGMERNVIRSFVADLEYVGLDCKPLLIFVEESEVQEKEIAYVAG